MTEAGQTDQRNRVGVRRRNVRVGRRYVGANRRDVRVGRRCVGASRRCVGVGIDVTVGMMMTCHWWLHRRHRQWGVIIIDAGGGVVVVGVVISHLPLPFSSLLHHPCCPCPCQVILTVIHTVVGDGGVGRFAGGGGVVNNYNTVAGVVTVVLSS